jgi:hypothetical protein
VENWRSTISGQPDHGNRSNDNRQFGRNDRLANDSKSSHGRHRPIHANSVTIVSVTIAEFGHAGSMGETPGITGKRSRTMLKATISIRIRSFLCVFERLFSIRAAR